MRSVICGRDKGYAMTVKAWALVGRCDGGVCMGPVRANLDVIYIAAGFAACSLRQTPEQIRRTDACHQADDFQVVCHHQFLLFGVVVGDFTLDHEQLTHL
jgi:hypothetical protein